MIQSKLNDQSKDDQYESLKNSNLNEVINDQDNFKSLYH